jgi:hypothetical protein
VSIAFATAKRLSHDVFGVQPLDAAIRKIEKHYEDPA